MLSQISEKNHSIDLILEQFSYTYNLIERDNQALLTGRGLIIAAFPRAAEMQRNSRSNAN